MRIPLGTFLADLLLFTLREWFMGMIQPTHASPSTGRRVFLGKLLAGAWATFWHTLAFQAHLGHALLLLLLLAGGVGAWLYAAWHQVHDLGLVGQFTLAVTVLWALFCGAHELWRTSVDGLEVQALQHRSDLEAARMQAQALAREVDTLRDQLARQSREGAAQLAHCKAECERRLAEPSRRADALKRALLECSARAKRIAYGSDAPLHNPERFGLARVLDAFRGARAIVEQHAPGFSSHFDVAAQTGNSGATRQFDWRNMEREARDGAAAGRDVYAQYVYLAEVVDHFCATAVSEAWFAAT